MNAEAMYICSFVYYFSKTSRHICTTCRAPQFGFVHGILYSSGFWNNFEGKGARIRYLVHQILSFEYIWFSIFWQCKGIFIVDKQSSCIAIFTSQTILQICFLTAKFVFGMYVYYAIGYSLIKWISKQAKRHII